MSAASSLDDVSHGKAYLFASMLFNVVAAGIEEHTLFTGSPFLVHIKMFLVSSWILPCEEFPCSNTCSLSISISSSYNCTHTQCALLLIINIYHLSTCPEVIFSALSVDIGMFNWSCQFCHQLVRLIS